MRHVSMVSSRWKKNEKGEQMKYPIIIVARLYKETLRLTAIDGFLFH